MNCLRTRCFYDIKEIKEALEKAVLFYNTVRPHMSINMMTPKRQPLIQEK